MNELDIDKLRASAEAGAAPAQFLLSQLCRENGQFAEMVRWLEKASDQNMVDAHTALGQCYETAVEVEGDLDEALALYDKAIGGGSSQAEFRKAELLYKLGNAADYLPLIRQLLESSARDGNALALRTVGVIAMHSESHRLMAMYCFRQAAQAGDPISAFNLAWCLSQGWAGGNADSHIAHWLRVAAARQYPFSEHMLRDHASAPPPSAPLFGDQEIRLDDSIDLFPVASTADCKTVNADLPVVVHEGVLTLVDCAHLMFMASPTLQRAGVINPSSDMGGMVSDIRTNSATYLYYRNLDAISRYIELKIVGAVGQELDCSEPLSVLHYAPGEYYKPHVDFFNPRLNVSKGLLKDGGQRTGTAVTCLFAPDGGGATSFPRLDISVPAETGNVLWFRNCTSGGEPDERSLHSGDTVEAGEKWVVTKWFREGETTYASPRLDYPVA